jgi:hypothetical protein
MLIEVESKPWFKIINVVYSVLLVNVQSSCLCAEPEHFPIISIHERPRLTVFVIRKENCLIRLRVYDRVRLLHTGDVNSRRDPYMLPHNWTKLLTRPMVKPQAYLDDPRGSLKRA